MTIDEILAKAHKEAAQIEKEQEERYQAWLNEERF